MTFSVISKTCFSVSFNQKRAEPRQNLFQNLFHFLYIIDLLFAIFHFPTIKHPAGIQKRAALSVLEPRVLHRHRQLHRKFLLGTQSKKFSFSYQQKEPSERKRSERETKAFLSIQISSDYPCDYPCDYPSNLSKRLSKRPSDPALLPTITRVLGAI